MDLWLPPKPAIIMPAPVVEVPRRGNLFFVPPPFIRKSAVTFSLSFHASVINTGSGTTSTLTLPGTVQGGDLIVLFNRGNGTAVTPGGYTNLANINSTFRCEAHYKIAVGGDAGAVVNGINASSVWRFTAIVIRPTAAIVTATPSTVNAEATAGDPALQNVAAGSGTPPLVIFAMYSCADAVIPSGTFSPAEDANIGNGAGQNFDVRYKIYNTSPSNTSVDQADGGAFNHLISFYIACQP
jgi:hypothetical protein